MYMYISFVLYLNKRFCARLFEAIFLTFSFSLLREKLNSFSMLFFLYCLLYILFRYIDRIRYLFQLKQQVWNESASWHNFHYYHSNTKG